MKNDGDKYEIMTIEQLEFEPHGSGKRSNVYIHDANLGNRKFEIKSYSILAGLISTGRGVSEKKIDEWEKVNWIFTGRDEGQIFKQTVIPKERISELFAPIREKIRDPGPRSKFAGTKEIPDLHEALRAAGWSKSRVNKVCNTFERGTRQNDPRLKVSEVNRLGIVVECAADIKGIIPDE